MIDIERDEHGVAQSGMEPTPEQTAAIYAAMMEELGIARKDTLPLEDKKGTRGHVDLDALDREKKAKDPRTVEFRIAQRNTSAHTAWKTAKFDDVDEADLELDDMDSGQSHRQRMKAALEASGGSRGGHAIRGGREGQLTRGGSNHSVSRFSGLGGHGNAKPDRVNINEVLARLGGPFVRRGRGNSSIRGTTRGSFLKPSKHVDDVLTPKPNLSFDDNRPVKALPFDRNATYKNISNSERGSKEPPKAPKAFKPNNYNQGFALASPEDFLAQSWAGKARLNAIGDDKKNISALNDLPDRYQKPQTATSNTSETDDGSAQANAAPSAKSTDIQHPCETAAGSLVDSSNDIAYTAPVLVGNYFGGKYFNIGSGIFRIKTVDSNPNIAKVIQIEVIGKTLLEQPLLESLQFNLDSCAISFYSGFEGRLTKWILTASQPNMAKNLVEALERLKSLSKYVGSADTSTKDHIDEMAKVEEVESLISFSEEDLPPQAVSQFTQDLFSLMGNQFIEEAVNAINVKVEQNSTTMAVQKIMGTGEAADTQKRDRSFRGLATSRFANNVEVGDFFNTSAVFQKLPDSTATYIREQVSKRVFEKTQKDTCDQEVFETAHQQARIQYSVEELVSLGKISSSVKKPSALNASVDSSATVESCPVFSFPELARVALESPSLHSSETTTKNNSHITRFGMSNISDGEKPQGPAGLATSKYASPHAAELFREPSNSEKSDPPATKPFQGLSTSKYAGSQTERLLREPSDSKKPDSPAAKKIYVPSSSKDRISHAVKSFQSFLSSVDREPVAAKPLQQLSISKLPDPPLEDPLQRFSISSHPENPTMKPFQGLASSKYASPFTAKHGFTKTFVSTAQSGPKNLAVVAKSSIPNAMISNLKYEKMNQTSTTTEQDGVRPAVISMIMEPMDGKEKYGQATISKNLIGVGRNDESPFPMIGSWNSLKRRDSFNSHASKDSNETVKPPVPKPITKPVQDHAVPVQSWRASSSHHSILSIGSSASCESFATAAEEKGVEGETGGESDAMTALSEDFKKLIAGKPPTSFEAPASDFVLFPDDTFKSDAIETVLQTKSSYSSDMSELMKDSFAVIPQPGPHGNLASLRKPLNFPTVSPRKRVAKAKGGLMSSRFATDVDEVALGVLEPESQPLSATVSTEVKGGLKSQKLVIKPFIGETDTGARPRVLKPTASQFMPSACRSSTAPTPDALPPVVNRFSTSMQPVTATVLVQDPHCPGVFREVSGLLKMGRTPIIGYVAAQNSPMGENFTFGGTPVNNKSFQGTLDLTPRPPLSPIRQTHKNVQDKQQEVQERLQKSLSQRRLSESPGSNGF